jgi:hypothetical protein
MLQAPTFEDDLNDDKTDYVVPTPTGEELNPIKTHQAKKVH